jgi:hypothetical protein
MVISHLQTKVCYTNTMNELDKVQKELSELKKQRNGLSTKDPMYSMFWNDLTRRISNLKSMKSYLKKKNENSSGF